MKTNFTFLLLIFSFFISNLTAQNVVWEEQFNGGFNGWTEDTISTSGDSLSWKWTDTGSVGPVMLNPIPAPNCMSPTATNGAVYVNFEYWMYGADLANVPDVPPYGNLVSHLISPSIDLSDVTGSLSLRFFQLAKLLNADSNFDASTMVSFSPDGGQTWSDMIDLNPNLEIRTVSDLPRTIQIPSNFGLQEQADVRIRITYANDFYYFMIDDIELIEGLRNRPNDLKINKNGFAIPANYSTPVSQTEPIPFLADIHNTGAQSATSLQLDIQIRNIGTGQIVFANNTNINQILPGDTIQNVHIGQFHPNEVGLYEGIYTVTSDLIEDDLTNNSATFQFEISKAQFRKENGLNLQGVTSPFNNSWSIANVFYIPNNGYPAGYVTFGVANADELAGQFIIVKLYKWDGTMVDDITPDFFSMSLISFTGYTLDGTENNQIIEFPIDLDRNSIQLNAGSYYIVELSYEDLIDQECYFLATKDHDYTAMVSGTQFLEDRRFGTLIDFGDGKGLTTKNFDDAYYVPTIQLNPPFDWCSTFEFSSDNHTGIFPNPASDLLNLDLDFSKKCDLAEISIFDASGKVFIKEQQQNIHKKRLSFDLKNYPTGTYFLKLKTSLGERTLPFSVQR